jgi:exodeoxyribonuclease VII large subunit
VAEFLVGRLREAEQEMEKRRDRVARAARRATDEARRTLSRARSGLLLGAARLRAARTRLDVVARALGAAAPRRLTAARADLASRARLLDGLRPERVLARGYSVTRTESGVLVRAAADVARGQALRTTVASGTISSRVEAAS